MANKKVKKIINIGGMTCGSCEMKVQAKLDQAVGIDSAEVSYANSRAIVSFDEKMITLEEIKDMIVKTGYHVLQESVVSENSIKKGKSNIVGFIGIIAIAVILFLFTNTTGGLNFIPEVTQSMGYGILFVVGLMTSVHCIAMCGGINLSQSISKDGSETEIKRKLKPTLLYNMGRVISYTIIGGIVGAIGSVISFSGTARGVVAIIAGVFMIIMGLNMLNIFPALRKIMPRMPKKLSGKIHGAKSGKGPLIVGLLNGFMPCGPLQAMQIYALGTGSFFAGALSMFMFSIGTVPLMFGFGALGSLLSSKFTKKLMWVSAALVMILGFIMMGRGLNQSGISVVKAQTKSGNVAVVQQDVQQITTNMHGNIYESFTVQAGVPVRWTIIVEEGDLNGCNNPLTVPKYNIEKKMVVGENVIEFTPESEGDILYTCWMGMIDGNISVVADITDTQTRGVQVPEIPNKDEQAVWGEDIFDSNGSSRYSESDIGYGKIENGVQTITVTVSDDAFSPAIIVLERDVETKWNIIGENLTSCNESLIFPSYNAKMDLNKGDNIVDLMPKSDFGYSCWMSMIQGYVKVVDDVDNVDVDALLADPNVTASLSSGGSCGTDEGGAEAGGSCCN